MKKSELKKRLIEALTPEEAAKVEPKYKETYAAMIKGKGPLKLKKYDNPDAVVRGKVVNDIKNESLKIAEKLGKTADVGDYKDDFRKSGAPQFKGKSKKKRDEMATAAFLSQQNKLKEGDLDEEISNISFQKHASRVEDLLKQLIGATKSVDQSQDSTEDDVEELDKSIDYLSAALTDKDPIDIELDQSTFGRLAKPTKEEKTLEEIDAIMEEDELTKSKKNKLKKVSSQLKKSVKAHDKQSKTIDKIVSETGQEIAKKNMDDYKRLNELVKVALMGPISEKKAKPDFLDLDGDGDKEESMKKAAADKKKINENRYDINDPNSPMGKLNDEYESSGLKGIVDEYGLDVVLMMLSSGEYGDRLNETSTDKYDNNPALKGKQSKLPDGLQKSIIKKKGGDVDESFDSLSKKIDKQKGKSKKDADNIAGYIANIKRKGGGKGPTAKQKKRMAETILKELKDDINKSKSSTEKDLPDVEVVKKYLPKINNKGEYLEMLNIILNMGNEIPGVTPILKRQQLLAFIKTLGN